MKFNAFFIIALGGFAVLEATSDQYVEITNNHGQEIEVIIMRISRYPVEPDYAVLEPEQSRRIENISTIRDIGFKGRWDEEYTKIIDNTDVKKHPQENLDVKISAPYSMIYYPTTGGYGPWEIDKIWRDPVAEQKEFEEGWEMIEQPAQQDGLLEDWTEMSA